MKPLTFGSLFAGIGGLDLGFERAGLRCKWQVENEPFCLQVLAKHWPNVRRHDDIRTFNPGKGWGVDVLAGGFPCQDISDAGKKLGITGARSGLWSEYARIIRLLRPRFVVVENVAALLRRGLGRVLGDLAESGYDAEWDCLPLCEFGAPNERERTFIVAYPSSDGRQGNRIFRVQGTERRTFEALDAWNSSSSPFREWEKLLAKSRVERVAGGFAARLDKPKRRLRATGNVVSPQVAEWIGRRIVAALGDDA